MKDKFIRKYMNIAKVVGEYENPCFSRKIGSVIVNPETNSIVGTGYNGPPKGVPHCDSEWHIRKIIWDNLSYNEKLKLLDVWDKPKSYYEVTTTYSCALAAFNQVGLAMKLESRIKEGYFKNKCPRRILHIPSGKRTELCTCEHSERNAIYNSQTSTQNCYIFCYCCLPCMDCSKAIINSEIKKIYCLEPQDSDYSPQSRPMLNVADVEIIERPSDWYGV